MPNRTIYLTEEQDAAWKHNLVIARAAGESIGDLCTEALQRCADKNADLAALLEKKRKEKANAAGPV